MADNILGSLAVKLKAITGEFSASLSGAVVKLDLVKGKMAGVSAASAAMAASLAFAGKKLVDSAGNFEFAMTRVGAVSNTLGTEDFERLKQAARQLGEQTEWSAQQAAEGMQFMAMAGMKTDQIISAMPSALQLATAGNIDLANAADIVTNIVTGMRIPFDKLADSNDSLVAVMTNSNVSVGQLGEAFKYVGPVAVSAGMSFNEVAAAIGMLGNAGIQGSMAGTTLRESIARLVKQTPQATEGIKKLGVSLTDSRGKMLPFVELIRRLEPHADRTAELMQIFGMRAGPGMAALIGQGADALQKLIDKTGQKGLAKAIQEAQLNTYQGQMKLLDSAIESTAITMGDILLPAFRSVVESVKSAVDVFNNLPDSWKEMIVYAGVAATALLGVVSAMAGLAALVPVISSGIGAIGVAFGVITGPVLLLVVAIAGVVYAVGGLREAWAQNIGDIQGKTKAAIESIKNGFSNMWKDITEGFDKSIRAIKDAWIQVKGMFSGKSTEQIYLEINASHLQDEVKKQTDALRKTIEDGFEDAANEGESDISDGIIDSFEFAGKGLVKILKDILPEGILDGFQQGIEALGASVPSMPVPKLAGGGGGSAAGEDPWNDSFAEDMRKQREKMLKAESDAQTQAAVNAANRAEEAGRVINNAWSSAVSQLNGSIGTIVQGFMQGGLIGGIVTAIFELLKKTEGFQKSMDNVSKAFEIVAKLFDRISVAANGLEEGTNMVLEAIVDIVQPLFDAVGNLFMALGPITEIITKMLTPILKTFAPIIRTFGAAINAIAFVILGIIWGLSEAWNAVLDVLIKLAIKDKTKKALENMKADTDSMEKTLGNISDSLRNTYKNMWSVDEEKDPNYQASIGNGISFGGATAAAAGANGGVIDFSTSTDEAVDSLDEFGDTIDSINESLSNVPTGFKTAYNRFAAMSDTVRENQNAIMSGLGVQTVANSGITQQGSVVNIDNVHVNGTDATELYNNFERLVYQQNYMNTGSSVGSTSEGNGVG